MSYTITKTDGTTLGTILDGTINTSFTSLTLVGRNYANYGQIIANDFVRLIENFAYSSAPSNPLAGQLWWNTTDKRLRVATADGGPFRVVSGCTAQGTAPTSTVAGDLWWDTSEEQLYIYDGTTPYASAGWKLVGPTYKATYGKSGALWEQITDSLSIDHNVVSIYLDGVRTAIISADPEFTPLTGITGFTSIKSGWNMSTADTIFGTANNASYLGGVEAARYLRSDENDSTSGTLAIANNGGLTVGASAQFKANVSSNDVTVFNTTSTGDLNFNVGQGVRLTIDGATGEVQLAADPLTNSGATTKQYVDNKFNDTVLYGIPTAPTAPAGTSNLMLATTEFVASGLSGIFKYKIYQGNSHMWIDDAGAGAANLVIDGSEVMTATSSGVAFPAIATALTVGQTYNGSGNAAIATTQYVKTATTWWGNAAHRSAKWVSTSAPSAGVNDIGSQDGDIWFQREA